MYGKWFIAYVVLYACVMICLLYLIWKKYKVCPSKRMKCIMLGILTVGLLVSTLTTASHRLLKIELTHYNRLFRAYYVECNNVDVTELVQMYAKDCWDFAQMEEVKLGNGNRTEVGTLSFYNEKNRLFHQINIVMLNEDIENPRIYTAGGRKYAFLSNDWRSYGYVYGFPKKFAEKILLLTE